jgi:hypothetical protein
MPISDIHCTQSIKKQQLMKLEKIKHSKAVPFLVIQLILGIVKWSIKIKWQSHAV